MDDKAIYRLLGRSVAARRSSLGLTQQDLADKVGVSRASIANIECGRQKVLLHQVYGLVVALDLKSIVDLIPTLPPKRESAVTPQRLAVSGNVVSDSELVGIEQLIHRALGGLPAGVAQ